MGCDIHLFVERRTDAGWEHVPGSKWYETRDHFDTVAKNYAAAGKPSPYTGEKPSPLPCFDPGRNYDLFAVLADVCNGVGFAGCDMGDPWTPIDQPRGIPKNACDLVRKERRRWGSDGHSHSWFTLAELQAFDWSQTTERRGFVGPKQYAAFREHGKPVDGYRGGVGGGGVRKISRDEMDRYIADGCPKDERARYTRISWNESAAESCSNFVNKIMPALATLGPPEDVRIVFWFDN